MEQNSPTQPPMTEEEKARPAEWEKKRSGYLKYLDLDSAPPETQFIDINYDNGEKGGGRMLICLGQFALHARMVGTSEVTWHDESIAMNKTKDIAYDNVITILRQDVGILFMTRHEIDWTIIPEAPPENERHQYNYTLHVKHPAGEIAIHGLTREAAVSYKKVIYNWRIFNNIIIIPNP